MTDLFSLKEKTAVVLGGAGGIGEALALGLAQQGAQIVVGSRNLEKLAAVTRKIESETSSQAQAFSVDVTDESSVISLVEKVLDKFKSVDILVNAMGINLKRDAFEFPVEDWDRLFDVNVKGTIIACKQFGKVMKEKGSGKIINLSSVRGIRGHTGGNAGYCATKGAVSMITRSLALEWAPHNINVNALGPALIITPGTIHIQQNPELAEKYKASVPMNRLGQPEDLVGACVFLASSASDFVTGQTIYVDGGVTA